MNVGQIVRLMSGGPLMTIESLDSNYAACAWFNGQPPNQTLERDSFVLATLRPYEPPVDAR